MSRGSLKPAAKPFEHLVTRNEFNFSALDFTDATLDLDPPRLVGIGIEGAVKGFDKSQGKLCPFSLWELSRLLLELG